MPGPGINLQPPLDGAATFVTAGPLLPASLPAPVVRPGTIRALGQMRMFPLRRLYVSFVNSVRLRISVASGKVARSIEIPAACRR